MSPESSQGSNKYPDSQKLPAGQIVESLPSSEREQPGPYDASLDALAETYVASASGDQELAAIMARDHFALLVERLMAEQHITDKELAEHMVSDQIILAREQARAGASQKQQQQAQPSPHTAQQPPPTLNTQASRNIQATYARLDELHRRIDAVHNFGRRTPPRGNE